MIKKPEGIRNTEDELLPVKPGIIAVDEWVPDEEDNIVRYVGKVIYIPFSRIFHQEDDTTYQSYEAFYGDCKDSYSKQFGTLVHYINYFIKFYDTDNELLLNYMHCKFTIDNNSPYLSRKRMIDDLYCNFVTDTMYNKIKAFVEDNYRLDLSRNKDKTKQYSEALEFTDDHAKLMLLISTFIKFMIPIITHYIHESDVPNKKATKYLIEYYKPLFDIVLEKEGVNLYAKLQYNIYTKTGFSEKNNPVIWIKYAATGTDAIYLSEELLDKNVIVDNFFKYVFNKNIIYFNSVILNTQVGYFHVKDFGVNLREISTEKDSDGLSYSDKLEMNMNKIDEEIIILSKININDTIKRLKKINKMKISKKEVRYYMEHTSVNDISKILVFYYYANIFNGFDSLNNISKKCYIKLMIMMKKRLALMGYILIPQIISANLEGRVNNRIIHNTKYNENIKNSPVFINLVNEKFPSLKTTDKETKVISLLNSIITSRFSIVDYNAPDYTGKNLEINSDTMTQEFLDMVNSI